MTLSPRLALVSGARRVNLAPEGGPRREVWLSSAACPPFAVDAVVVEEDTHLVSSAPAVALEEESPIRVFTAAASDAGHAVGAVVVRRGSPHHLLAIVHDFSVDPSCDVPAVRAALTRALEVSAELHARAIALPLLGAVHGVLRLEASAALVREALRGPAVAHLQRIWIVVDEARQREAHAHLTAPLTRAEGPEAHSEVR